MTIEDDNELIHMLASMMKGERGVDSSKSEGSVCDRHRFILLLGGTGMCEKFEFSAPALSLIHEEGLQFNHENRNEAESSAFQLLSRNIGFEVESCQGAYEKLVDVSDVFLTNASESFAILVDSHLRANARFLSKHGRLSTNNERRFELVNRKLHTLLELGNRVIVSHVETKVDILDSDDLFGNAEDSGSLCSGVLFQLEMKLFVDSCDGSISNNLLVHIETQGSLSVSRDRNKCTLSLDFDIKELLAQMKQQAFLVVAQVLEMTNSYFAVPVLPNPIFQRGDSYHVMPPPLPPHSMNNSCPNTSNKDLAMISPDVSALSCQQSFEVPRLVLNEHDEGEDKPDIWDLSTDQCEDILDDIFGGVDIAVFSKEPNERPAKKLRTNE